MPARKKKTDVKVVDIETLEKLINKEFGPRTLIRASDESLEIQRVPTGVLALDRLLGGGFARGRHTETYGDYNVGKTALNYRLIAKAQELGLNCAYLDVEGTFAPDFAAHLGVDLDALTFPPELKSGNRAVDIMDVLIRSELYGVIVLDSIAALSPQAEQDKRMDEGDMGTAQAKLMSKALRKLTAALNAVEEKPILSYINQTRQKVGIVFGNPTVTSGGKAMGFYAGTRIGLTRTEDIKRKGRVVDTKTGEISKKDVLKGHRVLLRVEKDKTGGTVRGRESTLVFDYDLGDFDPIEDVIYCGLDTGMIIKKGDKWWVKGCEDEKITYRKPFKKYLKNDPEFVEDLADMIREYGYDEEEDTEDES